MEDNATPITNLKSDIEIIYKEVNELKGKVSQLEIVCEREKEEAKKLESCITELERYSRRWNLKLHGITEQIEDKDVRQEVVRICQKLLPAEAERIPHIIDTVHRSGRKKTNGPRSLILQFSWREHSGNTELRCGQLQTIHPTSETTGCAWQKTCVKLIGNPGRSHGHWWKRLERLGKLPIL